MSGHGKLDYEGDENIDNDDMDEAPPSIDPYEVLGLEKEATADDVKKAYRKMALKCHPDKSQDADKTAANKKFQEIAFAYAVLSDDTRRKRYDLTGSTAETLADDEFDWLSFYRQQFEDVITEDSINKISEEYKDSVNERRDLLEAYTKTKGNLDKIYDLVMLSDIIEDDDRFRKILDEEIENGTIDSFPTYKKQNTDAARKKAKDKELKRRAAFDEEHGDTFEEAKAKAKSKSKKDDMAGLAALIQRKQASRGSFFDHLEAKYAPKTTRSGKRLTSDEPSEDAFAASRPRKRHRSDHRRRFGRKDLGDPDIDGSDIDIVTYTSEDEESEKKESEEYRPPRKSKKERKDQINNFYMPEELGDDEEYSPKKGKKKPKTNKGSRGKAKA